jgi:hypothetical protein
MAKKPASILEELLIATEADPLGKKEDEQEFLVRLSESVADLEQADWDGLSSDAQEWYNAAVDANNSGDELPHPDNDSAPAPAKKPAPAVKKPAPAPAKPVPAKKAAKPEPEPEEEEEEEEADEIDLGDIVVGQTIRFVMKKGEDITGVVSAADDDSTTIVDEDDDETDVLHKRVDVAVLVEDVKKPAKKAAKPVPAKKAAKPEPEDDDDTEEEEEEVAAPAKKPRIRGAVSVTGRIRDIMCANTSLDKDGVGAQLTKEGIEFNPTTLQLQFTEVSRTIEALKALGKLKK